MKWFVAILMLLPHYANAQQYGWVRVAQLGNSNTTLQAVDFVDSLHGWCTVDTVCSASVENGLLKG